MELFGIGPLELLFILVIALIILGPGDMVKAGLTLGRFLRKIISSPEWHTIQRASRELRYLPNRLMREANLDDLSKDMSEFKTMGNQLNNEVKKMDLDLSSWTTPPKAYDPDAQKTELDESKIKTMDSSGNAENSKDAT